MTQNNDHKDIVTEKHPLAPFIPQGARMLMLGSFPPPASRWSMNFFYPNLQNDMWRIFGIVFFDNKNHFIDTATKKFCKEIIVGFLTEKKIALSDTALEVQRLKSNASDKFLNIVQSVDISSMLAQMPCCEYVVTTGQKATETLAAQTMGVTPAVGEYSEFICNDRRIIHYRMPSSSRAYPLSLDKKAEIYRKMFIKAEIL